MSSNKPRELWFIFHGQGESFHQILKIYHEQLNGIFGSNSVVKAVLPPKQPNYPWYAEAFDSRSTKPANLTLPPGLTIHEALWGARTSPSNDVVVSIWLLERPNIKELDEVSPRTHRTGWKTIEMAVEKLVERDVSFMIVYSGVPDTEELARQLSEVVQRYRQEIPQSRSELKLQHLQETEDYVAIGLRLIEMLAPGGRGASIPVPPPPKLDQVPTPLPPTPQAQQPAASPQPIMQKLAQGLPPQADPPDSNEPPPMPPPGQQYKADPDLGRAQNPENTEGNMPDTLPEKMPPDPQPTPIARGVWEAHEPKDPRFPVDHKLEIEMSGAHEWYLAGASIRGKGHAHDAKYREDSFAISFTDDWNIIAVSDGAGSREFSRLGSKEATTYAVQAMEAYWQENCAGQSFDADGLKQHIHEALIAGASSAYRHLEAIPEEEPYQQENVSFTDLGCTLLLTIHCPFEDKHMIGAFQMGDGAVILAKDQHNLDDFEELTEADSGEAGGETYFITSYSLERWLENKQPDIRTFDRMWVLMNMTDGVADDMIPYTVNIPRILLPAFERAEILPLKSETPKGISKKLSVMIDYEKKASFDDRTLVILFNIQDNQESTQHQIAADVDTDEEQMDTADEPEIADDPDRTVRLNEDDSGAAARRHLREFDDRISNPGEGE